ncbi:hypothetical protein [Amycolatopsis minnesotensis]|uniref:hypothetical protein n=1 Tax=Amycolatopsis minnesotensis TaxID=337894 RepID=UPI0031DCD5DF
MTVVDLCCSYGINAALLNHRLTFEDLHAHYTAPEVTELETAELVEYDKDFYAARRRADAVPVIGVDIAAPAIDYALAAGLLDAGFAENLETGAASEGLLRAVRTASLITVTGGASFLGPRTFHQLLRASSTLPWVAAFVLRTGSYQPIATTLAEHGLTTSADTERTFVQRRFTDADEQRYAIAAVTAAGADPAGKEAEGSYHTALYLSQPQQGLAPTSPATPDEAPR